MQDTSHQSQNQNQNQNLIQGSIEHPQSSSQKVFQYTKNYVKTFDLYKYVPVPKGKAISSKESRFASIISVLIFLLYLGYQFYIFFSVRPSTTNFYVMQTPNKTFTLPDIAFGYIYYDSNNNTNLINDPKYFTYHIYDYTRYQFHHSDNFTQIQVVACQPSWLKGLMLQNNLSFLLCPQRRLNITGIQGKSKIINAPYIYLQNCTSNCSNFSTISLQGKFFLFIHNNEAIQSQNDAYDFTSFIIFSQSVFYLDLIFQVHKNITNPNYLTQFTITEQQYFSIYQQKNQNYGFSGQLLSIDFALYQQIEVSQTTYTTILTEISLWGGFKTFLFGVFAFFCLKRNQRQFEQEHSHWQRFEYQQRKSEAN